MYERNSGGNAINALRVVGGRSTNRLLLTEFARKLKEWRGNLRQKEGAAILGVSLRTYEAWESGARTPMNSPSIREVEQKMRENVR